MEDIEEKVSQSQKKMEGKYKQRHIRILKQIIRKTTPFLILLIITTLFLKFSITLTPQQERWLFIIDQIVIMLFATDLIIDYTLSYSKIEFLKKRWFSILLFLPLFGSLSKVGKNAINALHYSELLSTNEKAQSIFALLENNALTPAFKTTHVTNISAHLARTSYLIEKFREI